MTSRRKTSSQTPKNLPSPQSALPLHLVEPRDFFLSVGAILVGQLFGGPLLAVLLAGLDFGLIYAGLAKNRRAALGLQAGSLKTKIDLGKPR